MDQAKVYLALAKKYHFWILCGVVVLIVVPCWWLGTESIAAQTEEKRVAIEGKFTTLQQLQSRPYHPNEQFVSGVRSINLKQSELIYNSWQELYEYQKRVLVWPAGLSEAERELFASGKFFNLAPTDRVSTDARARYRDVLLRSEVSRLENWLQLLKPKPLPPGVMPPMPGMPGPMNDPAAVQVEYEGLVLWPGFENIFNQYPWLTNDRIPTPLQVKFCQEDIWVYSALFEVINKTNEGVDNWRKAWVKHIITLEIGQQVPGPARTIMASLQANAPQIPGEGGNMGEGGPAPDMAIGEGGVPMTGVASADMALRDRRYVDQTGKPLLGSAESPNPEYNLMPFRMVLGMDQRRIAKLLSACANSDLPIGVQQVQLFQQTEMPPVGQSTGMQQMSGVGLGHTHNISGVDGAKLPDPKLLYTPYDAVVEVRGVLYIFQPPDIKKLPELAEERERLIAERAANGETNPVPAATVATPTEPAGATPAPAATTPTAVPGEAAGVPAAEGAPGDAAPAAPATAVPAPATANPAAAAGS